MSLEAKKISVAQIILSINDENLIDQIVKDLIQLMPFKESKIKETRLDKYRTTIEPVFDLDKIKKNQNYQGINPEKMDTLIEEADIQESLEDLLKMI